MTISVELFGKDHWSTFAYIETRVVDHEGWIDTRHMRGHLPGWEQYPTRIKGRRQADGTFAFRNVKNHSDFDCVMDLIEAGLIEGGRATKRNGRGEIEALTYRYSLTLRGETVAGLLRAWKGRGENFHDFEPGVTACL